ncbi:MAG: hypothetical protein KAQ69_04070, partial [Spirochaetales bacterium]|nr:hypothetical protein [Spirochaetales bacterium]
RDEQQLAIIDPVKISQAADLAVKYFRDKNFRDRAVEQNLKIARTHYSMESLQKHLHEYTKYWQSEDR